MEKEPKWTPGPWRANSSWIEGPKMALRIAAVDWPKRGCAPHTKEEAEANARLIATAPDLYAALHKMLAAYDFGEHFPDDHPIVASRAALNKANP